MSDIRETTVPQTENWVDFGNGLGFLPGEPVICIVCDRTMSEAGVVGGKCAQDGGEFVVRSQKYGA